VTAGAERRRLLHTAARLARRRSWAAVARDRAAARLVALDAEMAAAEAELVQPGILEGVES
jgi:hypothetical protein